MDKRKLLGTIIGVFAFIALVLGATYAYFAWSSNSSSAKTNVNLTISKDLEELIVYNQGTSILETSGKELEVSNNYTGGINATIEFWKKKQTSKPIYGQISLKILNLLSVTDTNDANIAKTETVKWAITTYNVNDSTEVLLNQGTFKDKQIGDKWAITQDFELNNYQTFYKVYLWLDAGALDMNYPVSGELLSTEISAAASDTLSKYKVTFADEVIALASEDNCKANASGVCGTNSFADENGETKYHDYRYRGAEVDNYVWFNNDLYRVIGVFDENSHGVPGKQLVKLISDNLLSSNSYGVYNGSKISGSYSSYKNDWSGTTTGVAANSNVLLNQFFYNKTKEVTGYSNCTTWTYFNSGNNYKTNDCSDIVGYGIDASVRDYIEEVTWYLKGYSSTSFNKQAFYTCERSEDTVITSCTSGNKGEYANSTKGYIGLMYASDYVYASSYYSSTNTTNVGTGYHGNKNWLYKGYEWTITPDGDSANSAFGMNAIGRLASYSTYIGNGVRPTFYLKSSVYVTGGSGTHSDPYTIACDDCSL